MNKRLFALTLTATATVAAAALTLPLSALAQAWPAKPVRMVIPFPAGGATDIIGRTIAQTLGAALGQQVVVDNKPGAGGTIGADMVAKAPADGYTPLDTGCKRLLLNKLAELACWTSSPRVAAAPDGATHRMLTLTCIAVCAVPHPVRACQHCSPHRWLVVMRRDMTPLTADVRGSDFQDGLTPPRSGTDPRCEIRDGCLQPLIQRHTRLPIQCTAGKP